jgi:EAL domain-containing protein (putative c-di-GMP-specific phosphodiesterase class I)
MTVISIAARTALTAMESMIPSFQPVVSLATAEVVGVEALARWPSVDGVNPAEVFELARSRGVVSEIDFACRSAAVAEARTSHLADHLTLFLNYEPCGIVDVDRMEEQLDALGADIDIVLEITERGLDTNGRGLTALVAAARARGMAVALDDVGSDSSTVRALDVVQPDIVKLDAALLAWPRTMQTRRVLRAVSRYIDDAGATLLAEGIESPRHRLRALDIGASLGQGWLFGAAVASTAYMTS